MYIYVMYKNIGTQPNPICKNVPAIIDLFNTSSSLTLIDKKGG